ncbi:uncharacterized protein LOC127857008 [Dreissena polymorpha]|uniref:uncharacterized protein LOC127857008 n=1 Tax=Dreissena polymorpha TaxID=45954 RepID=UPI002264F83B|nr:uncharacterized protein LOC127857008 [Dreissena polymorpha]
MNDIDMARTSSRNTADLRLEIYSDLIDMIGINNSCVASSDGGNSSKEKSDPIRQHKVTLSRPAFHEQNRVDAAVGRCEAIDLVSYRLENATWACCTASHNINWIFVDCAKQTVLALACLNLQYADDLLSKTCGELSLRHQCLEFQSLDGNGVWCSKTFFAETVITERAIAAPEAPVITMETAAYMCAAFILVAFILAVIIPESKCRPSYKYDKEKALRVPLEIYEMCGETYKPSAKKRRLNDNTICNERSRRLYAHFRNLSIAASTRSRTATNDYSKSNKNENENVLWKNTENIASLKRDLDKRINVSEPFNVPTCKFQNTLSHDSSEAANENNELHWKSDDAGCSITESKAASCQSTDNEGHQFDESCDIEDNDELWKLSKVARPYILSSELYMHSKDEGTNLRSTHIWESSYRGERLGDDSTIDKDQYRINIGPMGTKIPNVGYPLPFCTMKKHIFSAKHLFLETSDLQYENPFDLKDFLDCSTIAKRSNKRRQLTLDDSLEYKATLNNNELLFENETRGKSRRQRRNRNIIQSNRLNCFDFVDSHDLGQQPNRDGLSYIEDEKGMDFDRVDTKLVDLLSEIKRHHSNKRLLSRISERVDESLNELENDITACRFSRKASIC